MIIFKSQNALQQAYAKLAARTAGLLAPDSGICRYCLAPARVAAQGALGLCRECAASIPWIRDVQCDVCGRYEACPDCGRRETKYFERNRSAVRYNASMKQWLARYKYRGDERLCALMADMLLHAYRLHQTGGASQHVLLTFVPLNETRRTDRGFNQAEQMARELGGRLKLPVVPLLQRNRHTEKQSLKKRIDRLRDMQDLFSLHEEGHRALRCLKPHTPNIYVVDDVYTTGSTLNECAKAIRIGHDARVYGLTFAR